MSLQVLLKQNPNAVRLLQLFAFLDPDEIRVDYLKRGRAAFTSELATVFENEVTLVNSLADLESCSLIKVTTNHTVTVHRLVQLVVRDAISEPDKLGLKTAVICSALKGFPTYVGQDTIEICRNYSTHAITALQYFPEYISSQTGSFEPYLLLLDRLSYYLYFDGYYKDETALRYQLFMARKHTLGLEHPDTLGSMNGLAAAYGNLGRNAEAAQMLEQTLEVQKRTLGPEHSNTLWTMNGLGVAYGNLGWHSKAAQMLEQTLEGRKRTLGPDHRYTLWTMNGLGVAYGNLGRNAEAVQMLEQTLEARKRTLGPEDPNTLRSIHDLANIYVELGRNTEAAQMHEQTLEVQRRTLGPEHLNTLRSMNGLAIAYGNLGRNAEAVQMLEQTLEARKRALGPEHPDTLRSMRNLALTYANLGLNQAEVAQMLEETLEEWQKLTLGSEHPDS
jgi:tetratricopeptide (TPR) repeat protein